MSKEKTPEEIATEIFYLPASNGKHIGSIKQGADLIKDFARQEVKREKINLLEEIIDASSYMSFESKDYFNFIKDKLTELKKEG